jgi:hypothetical protein
MGCDWVMQPLIAIRYIDNNGIERCYEFIDFDGCIGIYITDCDYDATRQMNEWTNKCPNTIIYENSIWNKRANDIVYESPNWCGISIQYTKNRMVELICDQAYKIGGIENVVRIEIAPQAERR